MLNKLGYIFLLFVILCCSKEKYSEDVTETPDANPNQPPGEFELFIDNITDTEIHLSWTHATDPDSAKISYEIILSDSVIAYDLNQIREYTITNLSPGTEYTICVLAVDEHRAQSMVCTKVSTVISFLQNIIYFDLFEGEDYRINYAAKTKDNGIILVGDDYNINFNAKIDSNFQVEWLKITQAEMIDYMQEIVILKNGDYLIVRQNSVTRIDNFGNELWKLMNTENPESDFFNCAEEDDVGNILVGGIGKKECGKDSIISGYLFVKLNANGQQIWRSCDGNISSNRISDILCKPDGSYLLFGTAVKVFGSNSFDNYSLIKTDSEGIMIEEFIYPSEYRDDGLINNGGDVPMKEIFSDDNAYLLLGVAGISKTSYDIVTRFMKIDEEGEVIWDRHDVLATIPSCSVKYIGEVYDNSFLLLFYDGYSERALFAHYTISGDMIYSFRLDDYPGASMIFRRANNYYYYLSYNGILFEFNPEGYR